MKVRICTNSQNAAVLHDRLCPLPHQRRCQPDHVTPLLLRKKAYRMRNVCRSTALLRGMKLRDPLTVEIEDLGVEADLLKPA